MKHLPVRRLTLLIGISIMILHLFPGSAVRAARPEDVCPSGCAFSSIAAAIAAAAPNAAITIDPGTYHETNINISKNITLKGVGSTLVIVDAQNNGQIFSIGAGLTVYMQGMTLKNANNSATDNDGGAIFNQGTLYLEDMKFLNNHTDDMGGAIFNQGNLTITSSTLSGNNVNTARLTGASGGAIASASIGNLSLTDVTFTNNTAKYGGAIATLAYGHTAGKTFTLDRSTLSNNTATQQGGAIFAEQINTTITDTVINDNGATASFGGGLYFNDTNSTLSLQNVTISHNHGLNGGGIYLSPAQSVTLNGVTVTLNNSTDATNAGGGGIYAAPAIPLSIVNSIIAANTDAPGGVSHPDCYFSATSVTYSLIENATGCTATTFSNNVTSVNAQLDPLADYGGSTLTHRLKNNSPAIDSGSNTSCLVSDQRGVLRPKDGNNDTTTICDMGAYEVRLSYTITIKSNAAQDGWLLESSETSSIGGTANSTATTILLGDNAAKKQYRGILSFSTGAALPDNAVISALTLKFKKHSIVGGGNPVTTFQGFLIEMKTGLIGTAAALQIGDFQFNTGKSLGPATPTPVSNWYSINLTNAATLINKLATNAGLTQIRLRFKLDDNNDAIANYLGLYSGNAAAADRPQLVITYYQP